MEGESRLYWEAAPPRPAGVARAPGFRVLHGVLLAATMLTTTVAGALQAGVDPLQDPAGLARGLPFSLTLLCIILVHESGHYLMCLRYGVAASPPYVLPGPPLPPLPGTFGAFIRIRSSFPDRRALFDVGAAGPWAGFVVAVIAMIVGLGRSSVLPTAPETGLVVLGDSLVMSALVRLVLHADPATVVLSPIAYAGWFGFLITSLNLIPVGQLDGGHVLYAAAGRSPRFVSAILIAFIAWLGMTLWTGWLLWAALAIGFLTAGHPPTDDDGAPLGVGRRLAAFATLVLFVVTFVAEPFRMLP
jgi:membrane-associated protease RseP (regulator of RpoE activity)